MDVNGVYRGMTDEHDSSVVGLLGDLNCDMLEKYEGSI